MAERTAILIHSLKEIAPEDWDRCANPQGLPHDPFVSYAFLSALEDSHSVEAETGWAPCHLILSDGDEIHGVVPMYLKNHSQGEYVFDHNWAHAFERAGGNYYPKLQISVPFTPATGRRLLYDPQNPDPDTERQLLGGMIGAADQLGVSSAHLTFVDPGQAERLAGAGLMHRTDQQFHWENAGYNSFEAFLATLASRKRKNLKKERALAVENGIEIEWVTGANLTEAHWDAFFEFYMDTGSRKWGRPYLTRAFFSLIGERMADRVLLVMAKREGRYIAGAINFIGDETLFGRNWGCIEDHRFLHFECCYYQAIDFAIAHGLKRVEAGAQGAHKLARGYMPTKTHSLHWVRDPNFRSAIENYLDEERRYIEREIQEMSAHGPFKSNDPTN
ncbi:MAG: N-acetyltransferase [Alphaproteobacteria bacterium]|nr:MAG: N-acetyltransferase [Alphaproteobacteria bacterium]